MLYQQQNGEKVRLLMEPGRNKRWVGGYSRGSLSLSTNIGYILRNRIAVEAAAVAPWDNSLLKVGYSIPFFRMTCTRRERSIQTTFFSFYSSTSSYYLVDTTEKPFNAQCKHICY